MSTYRYSTSIWTRTPKQLAESQLRNALKVPAVACQQDQFMLQSGRRNEKIQIRDEIPLPPKQGTHPRKVPHRFIGDWQDGEERQKLLERRNMQVRLWVALRAFIQFAESDDADSQPLVSALLENVQRLRSPAQSVDNPVGIDQIAHGRSLGRVPSLRARWMSSISLSVSMSAQLPAARRNAS